MNTLQAIECRSVEFAADCARHAATWREYVDRLEDLLEFALGF